MFDFSFLELMLCFILALVVLGPERLPGVARGLGRWVGKARAYMSDLTKELERESQFGDIKRQVKDAHRVLQGESEFFHNSLKGSADSITSGLDRLDASYRLKIATESVTEPLAISSTAPASAESPRRSA